MLIFTNVDELLILLIFEQRRAIKVKAADVLTRANRHNVNWLFVQRTFDFYDQELQIADYVCCNKVFMGFDKLLIAGQIVSSRRIEILYVRAFP